MKRLLLAPLLLTLLVGCGKIDKTFTELKERRATNITCELTDAGQTTIGIKINEDQGQVTYTYTDPNPIKTWTVPASFTNKSILFNYKSTHMRLDRTNGKIYVKFVLPNGEIYSTYEGSCTKVGNTKTLF